MEWIVYIFWMIVITSPLWFIFSLRIYLTDKIINSFRFYCIALCYLIATFVFSNICIILFIYFFTKIISYPCKTHFLCAMLDTVYSDKTYFSSTFYLLLLITFFALTKKRYQWMGLCNNKKPANKILLLK